MSKYYLAYGSNLNVRQMKMRCPTAKIVGTAVIKNYELLFKGSKTGSYLTIEKKKGSSVPVAVWEVQDFDERSLDRYEGFPTFYYKKNFRIKNDGKTLNCFAYIMHEERSIGMPTHFYVRTVLEGYGFFRFDDDYIFRAIEKSEKEVRA